MAPLIFEKGLLLTTIIIVAYGSAILHIVEFFMSKA